MSRHRDESLRLRLRPARAVGFAVSLAMTLLAVVGAAGLIPTPSVADTIGPQHPAPAAPSALPGTALQPLAAFADRLHELVRTSEATRGRAPDRADSRADGPAEGPTGTTADTAGQPADRTSPAGSGVGRRVVFDMSAQQVWLVRDGGSVVDSYPVSGSIMDNLQPGRYAVYSRSRLATSFDYASTMRWMVRFTEGDVAAIGFHAIPRDSAGEPLQTVEQLGTPQSHGCIRQRPHDAKTLWDFAPVGTPVVVLA